MYFAIGVVHTYLGAPDALGEEGFRGYVEGTELHRAQGALCRDLPVRGHAHPGSLQEPQRGWLLRTRAKNRALGYMRTEITSVARCLSLLPLLCVIPCARHSAALCRRCCDWWCLCVLLLVPLTTWLGNCIVFFFPLDARENPNKHGRGVCH